MDKLLEVRKVKEFLKISGLDAISFGLTQIKSYKTIEGVEYCTYNEAKKTLGGDIYGLFPTLLNFCKEN